MKKFLTYLASAVFVWGGFLMALFAYTLDNNLARVGWALGAALMLCVALFLGGTASGMKWKKGKE